MVKAVVLSDYGPPEVLVPGEVEIGPPDAGQIRVNVGLAGVGPTDLAIRSGRLKGGVWRAARVGPGFRGVRGGGRGRFKRGQCAAG